MPSRRMPVEPFSADAVPAVQPAIADPPNRGLRAAGGSHSGLRRDDNQDLFHVDLARGLFMVIDGVGGQAAGGQAADVALTMLRARLERETGPVDERVREAITVANNEILRAAAARPEWRGMACVLTVAVVTDGAATIGHVGDTRLYKLREGRIDKVTRDHSPVGEREDAGELSEFEAMRHPRRNEVYRDVGSDPHAVGDADFIEIDTVPFERDAAMLLCSDGLSDLVPSAAIAALVAEHAGDPDGVVRALIGAANDAGGKDNVTVVYVEGDRFAARHHVGATASTAASQPKARHSWRRLAAYAIVFALAVVAAVAMLAQIGLIEWRPRAPVLGSGNVFSAEQVVRPGESISDAIARAGTGSQVVVEPGEYREQLRLRDGVRVVSREPRGATLRLPAGAAEGEAAVIANGLSSGNFAGFRIVGDAATPLGTGLAAHDSVLSIVDVEVTGATAAAIELRGAGVSLVGADVHDNPGAALVIRANAAPRVANSTFARNGAPERGLPALVIEAGARPRFAGNVFRGVEPDLFRGLGAAARQDLVRDNWFAGVHEAAVTPNRTAPPKPQSPRRTRP
jgi:serine/threonine protein phosphatase PrpC